MLLTVPHPTLSKTCLDVTEFDDSLRSLADLMMKIMHAEGGVGLAAPQVNDIRRVIVVNSEGGSSNKVLINPVIEYSSFEKAVMKEACLSLPGFVAPVLRSKIINVRYRDVTGKVHLELMNGFEARVVQHEFDHLNGITLLQSMKRR